jgi:cytidine deaminase
MDERQNQFDAFLETLPQPLRSGLQSIPQNSGMLDTQYCKAVTQTAGMSPESLMVQLLPVAKLYARSPISHFQVGAVAKARLSSDADEFALFMGANIEFTGQALTQTIHAEQAAVVNAWLQGAVQIDALAVSAVPCGRCRQFLYELETRHSLTVIVHQPDRDGSTTVPLFDLLPQAFGPQDLSVESGFISSGGHLPKLNLKTVFDDPLVHKALSAAERTYAPYTHNFAGCTIQISDQNTYSGSYVESAAFNPSLSPLHTSIIRMNMSSLATDGDITRAILVERPTSISQRGVSALLLETLAPDIELEYYEIR